MKGITRIFLISLMVLLSVSCSKEKTMSELDKSHFFVKPVELNEKTNTFLISGEVGHSGAKCPGCVTMGGVTRHIDCMNYGNYCVFSAYVELQQSGISFTATTIDTFGLTSEDFFAMPDRTFFFGVDAKGNDVYLNMPSQIVFRDSTSLQFTFTGLFSSNTPYYNNN